MYHAKDPKPISDSIQVPNSNSKTLRARWVLPIPWSPLSVFRLHEKFFFDGFKNGTVRFLTNERLTSVQMLSRNHTRVKKIARVFVWAVSAAWACGIMATPQGKGTTNYSKQGACGNVVAFGALCV